MKIKLFWLSLALLGSSVAQAGVTDIAQVPVLNIKGSGAVKPNLMLVYDNSGSMDFDYLPDVVSRKNNVDSNVCRGKSTLAKGRANCEMGHPPFNSVDFNKQYYNPEVRYTPPVAHDGTPFNAAAYGVKSPWDKVRTDPFRSTATNDLVTNFPDLTWCDSNGNNCQGNTVTYTYPDDTYYKEKARVGAPYYYTIKVAEYCKDANLTKCQSVAVGAAPPVGYSFPAKVRWCDDLALTTANCQAKTDKTHIYPRFNRANSGGISYGTLTLGATKFAKSQDVLSVFVNTTSGPLVITNATVNAPNGTFDAAERKAMVTRVASSINAKASANYLACVLTPTGSVSPAVSPCSSFGITLNNDDTVAVIPVKCNAGQSPKSTCATQNDGYQAGWDVGASVSSTPPTAVVSVTGVSPGSFTMDNITMGNTPLFTTAFAPGSTTTTAVQIAAALIAKINANTASKVVAYAGGNAITPTCLAATGAGKICLVDTASSADGAIVSIGNMTNAGTIDFAKVNSMGADLIPAIGVPLSAGNDYFVRTDIIPNNYYQKFPERSDCAGTVCTYTEEMNNFAMWYAFYRTRDLMMKTAVGQAFGGVSDKFRVGLALLRQTAGGQAAAVAPNTFNIAQRKLFYDNLYASVPSGGTPLRDAVNRVGNMYKTNATWVTELCQPNFMLVTTDGYWNGAAAAGVGDTDGVDDPDLFCTKDQNCTDTTSPNAGANSLADVALYWYRGGSNGAPVSLSNSLNENMAIKGVVAAKPGENTHLHINTYTLGLGMDGFMNYDPNYDNAKADPSGDFLKIKNGVTGCPWNNGGKYIWPDVVSSQPDADQQSRVDDLWHAAVNGHGKYFSASVPAEVVNGVQSALNNIDSVAGAASSAATSTPNISLQDNDIFSDTFTTGKWWGELVAQKLDPITGLILPGIIWNTSDTMGKMVTPTTDTRKIYMYDASAGDKLKPFLFTNMLATEKKWFENRCLAMAQCIVQDPVERNIANDGTNLVNWLRGQQKYANDIIYRSYASTDPTAGNPSIPLILGDIVSSKPAFLRDARKMYKFDNYEVFKTAQAVRKPMVFTAANDGMLHAFDASTGDEKWAYVPRITMSKLAAQASTNYTVNHQFTTDGSPDIADVQIGGVWRTVLVAGLGGGGRGFYALDVTNPAAPKALWELCADANVCAESNVNIGLTFGNAQFGTWDGKWVVFLTSGYNNIPNIGGVNAGDGIGHLFIVDVATGKILKDVQTGNGDDKNPSGFAKITAITPSPATDPKITYVYGGDNDGKMYRFDLSKGGTTVDVGLMADASINQPVTTRPDVSTCIVSGIDPLTKKAYKTARRVVLFGTGRLLGETDSKTIGGQSLYLLTDKDGTRQTVILRGASSTLVEQVLTAEANGDFTVTRNKVDLAVKDGWYLDFVVKGERVNLDPRIVNGGANVVTNIPGASTACTVGGTTNGYQVGLCDGSVPQQLVPPGSPPGTKPKNGIAGGLLSNKSAAVGFIIVRLPSGQLKQIITLADGSKVVKGIDSMDSDATRKVGWRRNRS